MNSEQLQEYLRQVVELEVQSQTAEEAYNACEYSTRGMGVPKNYVPPNKPYHQKKSHGIWGALGIMLCWFLLTSLIAFSATSSTTFWGFVCAIGFLVAGGFAIRFYSKRQDYNEECENEKWRYEEGMRTYKIAVKADEKRVESENEQLAVLNRDVALLDECRKKSSDLLEQFYALDVVKPKYRNLLCVATFLEYLENERCYTLTGPDGCYNKFEEEKRQGIIIAELYDISEQLSEIRINQELAADAFSSIDRNISELCAGVNGVRGKIDELLQDRRTQAYYTQQIAEEQRAMNNYTMMRDWLNS